MKKIQFVLYTDRPVLAVVLFQFDSVALIISYSAYLLLFFHVLLIVVCDNTSNHIYDTPLWVKYSRQRIVQNVLNNTVTKPHYISL